MLEDRYGNPLSTTSQAARDAYVDAVDRFLAAEPGVEAAFKRAIAADEGLALAHVGLAREYQMRAQKPLIAESLARARETAQSVTAREAAHVNALGLLLEGKVPAGFAAVKEHLAEHPRDAMISQTCMGVFGLIGFSGQPGREAEQLAFTTALAPHYGDDWWFLSQHAFAQLEIGQLGPAEGNIERALEIRPQSAHSAHVRAHLYYENGEQAAGLDYLGAWRHSYGRDGLLFCHVAWHVALWALEQGDEALMWEVIDADIAPGTSNSPPINVLTDSTAILYRAGLAGIEVPPERWTAISAYASSSFPKPGLAFADVHAALAHAMAGNAEALDTVIAGARGPAGDVVRALAEAFAAMAASDWAGAEQHLTLAMADHARIGGSKAQRDLVEFTMALVLLRQGRAAEARRLLSMHRPKSTPDGAISGLH